MIGLSISLSDIQKTLKDRAWFDIEPATPVNKKPRLIGKSVWGHVLEVVGAPETPDIVTLALVINPKELESLQDLLIMGPTFLRLFDSRWVSASNWINDALERQSRDPGPVTAIRNGVEFEISIAPNINTVFFSAKLSKSKKSHGHKGFAVKAS